MNCKHFTIRTKNYKKYKFCRLNRQVILDDCKNCSNFILKASKPIKKVSKKKINVSKQTYNEVIKRDMYQCRLCGTKLNLHLHHIDGRGKDLTDNINNCIMLCQNCHLNIVHKKLKKYRPILKEIIKNGKRFN